MRKCLPCPPDACGCPLTLLTLHPDLVLILFGFHATRLEALYFLFSLLPAVQTLHISPCVPSTLPSPACLHTQLTTVPPHEHGMLYGTNISAKHPLHHSLKLALFCFFLSLFLSNQCFSSLMENFQCHQHFAAPLHQPLGFPALEAVLTLSWKKKHTVQPIRNPCLPLPFWMSTLLSWLHFVTSSGVVLYSCWMPSRHANCAPLQSSTSVPSWYVCQWLSRKCHPAAICMAGTTPVAMSLSVGTVLLPVDVSLPYVNGHIRVFLH